MKRDQRAIRDMAFRLWEARGCPQGSAEEDWLEAERRLSSPESATAASTPASAAPASAALDEALKDTFPASDPPSGSLPDNPPSNADAKWQAAAAAKTADRRAKDSNRAQDPNGRTKSTPQASNSPRQ